MVSKTTSRGGRKLSSKTQKQNSIKNQQNSHTKIKENQRYEKFVKHRKLSFQKITFQPVTKAEVKMGQNATKAK